MYNPNTKFNPKSYTNLKNNKVNKKKTVHYLRKRNDKQFLIYCVLMIQMNVKIYI